MDEIKVICEHCHSNKIPFVISLYIQDSMINLIKFYYILMIILNLKLIKMGLFYQGKG
jgi:hypothetical protein